MVEAYRGARGRRRRRADAGSGQGSPGEPSSTRRAHKRTAATPSPTWALAFLSMPTALSASMPTVASASRPEGVLLLDPEDDIGVDPDGSLSAEVFALSAPDSDGPGNGRDASPS